MTGPDLAKLRTLAEAAGLALAQYRANFPTPRSTFVGQMPSAEFDDAVAALTAAVPALLDQLEEAKAEKHEAIARADQLAASGDHAEWCDGSGSHPCACGWGDALTTHDARRSGQ